MDNIIGHDRAKNILQKSIENNSISHSYLFQGEEGIGKKMVGTVFAKTLLCKENGNTPCNECISCKKIDNGHHPDLIYVYPENKIIRKHQVEEIIKEITRAPFESDKKVFIIDDSHNMNVESQNALLKTLEEPPEYVNIILITSMINKLLPTILSRVESIKFYAVNSAEISDYLSDAYGLARSKSDFISKFSKGAIGKSIKLVENENFFENRDKIVEIISALVEGDKTRAFSSMDFFDENKEDIENILDLFIYWFRDLLIYKEIGASELIINYDKLDLLSDHSFMNSSRINDIIVNIQDTKTNIRRNINYQLAIEVMLLNIGGR